VFVIIFDDHGADPANAEPPEVLSKLISDVKKSVSALVKVQVARRSFRHSRHRHFVTRQPGPLSRTLVQYL
jgi:hypothetical protein